jgi:hypothetical protein
MSCKAPSVDVRLRSPTNLERANVAKGKEIADILEEIRNGHISDYTQVAENVAWISKKGYKCPEVVTSNL